VTVVVRAQQPVGRQVLKKLTFQYLADDRLSSKTVTRDRLQKMRVAQLKQLVLVVVEDRRYEEFVVEETMEEASHDLRMMRSRLKKNSDASSELTQSSRGHLADRLAGYRKVDPKVFDDDPQKQV